MATTFAWKAVGVWFSFRVTCMTGQTSRQNLWPELKQPKAASCHCSMNSAWRLPSRMGSYGGLAVIPVLLGGLFDWDARVAPLRRHGLQRRHHPIVDELQLADRVGTVGDLP